MVIGRNYLNKKFYMPLLTKNAFGLDISDTSIEAVEIRKKMGKPTIVSFGRIELPAGLVANGIILDKNKLVNAVSEVVKKMGPRLPSTKNVVLSLPESRTFLHIFKLPAVIAEANLGESIQYEAEAVVPLSYDQIDFDYHILTKDRDSQEIFYAAAFKDTVNNFHEILRQAGLNPIVFEPESLSLARALVGDDMFEGVMIVDLGARTTIATIYDHSGIRLSENLPYAGNALSDKIAQALKISPQAAETAKKSTGLTKKDDIARAIEPVLQQIISSVGKAIRFYQKKTGYVITRVILCGGTSLLPGLVEFFQENLGVSVILGNPLDGLDYDKKKFKEAEAVLYSTVIGLAYRGFDSESLHKGINLIAPQRGGKKTKVQAKPENQEEAPEIKRMSKPKKRQNILLAVFIFLAAVFIGVFFWQRSRPLDTNYPVNGENQKASASATISAVVYTAESDKASLPSGALAGDLITKNIFVSQEFPATGKKTAAAKTSGIITVINDYSQSQSLVATTRLVTPKGILFRLKSGITIPANSEIEAEIYADQPENLPEVKPTKLTIPGLSSELQKYIYGQLDETLDSTSGEVNYVTENDIIQADLDMPKELASINGADLGINLADTDFLVTEPLSQKLGESVASRKSGDTADSFAITREYEVTALILKKEPLNKQVPATDWNIEVVKYDQDKGIVNIEVSASSD